MRIDAKQRRWFYSTLLVGIALVGARGLLQARSPERMTGGSLVGLAYGLLGAALLLLAGLLSAHRRLAKRSWVGSRGGWLRAHVWLSLLSLAALLCHSNFGWGGPLTIALWITYLIVLASGLFGVVVQRIVPRIMTTNVTCEAPYEQIPQICTIMRQKADQLVDQLCGAYSPAVKKRSTGTLSALEYAGDAHAQLRDFYETDLRPFLGRAVPKHSPLLSQLQAENRFNKLRALPGLSGAQQVLDQLARVCEERRLLLAQEKLHVWLHAWLLVHVPSSVLLLVLGIWHVAAALYY